MKEYSKILDVEKYEEQAKRQITIIRGIQEDDAKKYDFRLEKDAQNEQFFTLTKYYNGEQKAQIYNTIDVITEHLKAIKQSIIDFKINE